MGNAFQHEVAEKKAASRERQEMELEISVCSLLMISPLIGRLLNLNVAQEIGGEHMLKNMWTICRI